jgi:hypothetical protein
VIPKSARLAILPLLLVACGTATSTPAADDSEPTATPPTSASPSPSASPTQEPVSLDDFPLARGYPETNGNDGSPVVVTGTSGVEKLVFCHDAGWTPRAPVAPVDLIGTTYTGEAEDFRGRTLARYADAEEADSALTYLRRAVEVCPEDDGRVHDITPRHGGDGAYLVTVRYRGEYGFDTGLEVIDVVRVGDLVLLNWEYSEGGGSDETIRSATREVTDQSDALLARMCDYSAAPCDVPDPAPVLQMGPDGIARPRTGGA